MDNNTLPACLPPRDVEGPSCKAQRHAKGRGIINVQAGGVGLVPSQEAKSSDLRPGGGHQPWLRSDGPRSTALMPPVILDLSVLIGKPALFL